MDNTTSDSGRDAPVASWPGQSLGLPSDGVGSLAPVLTRLLARFTDGLLFLALHLLIVLVRSLTTGEFGWANPRPLQLALSIAGVFYELTMIALWGQTLGKMAAGIRVVSVRGLEVPGWGSSARRSFLIDGPTFIGTVLGATSQVARNLSTGIFLVDVLWMLRDRNRQTLHDKLADTVVVRDQRAVEIEQRRKSGSR